MWILGLKGLRVKMAGWKNKRDRIGLSLISYPGLTLSYTGRSGYEISHSTNFPFTWNFNQFTAI